MIKGSVSFIEDKGPMVVVDPMSWNLLGSTPFFTLTTRHYHEVPVLDEDGTNPVKLLHFLAQ
jgi:hypothetical protein